MSQTIIGLNHPQAVKRFSATLFVDVNRESYWGTRFMSKGKDAATPVQVLTELENDAGDTIKFDLYAQLKQKPTYGDQVIKDKEEALRAFQDSISIDQIRCGVNAGGRMTRKRTLHDLRMQARTLMTQWWSRWQDEVLFSYGAGTRGVNDDFIHDVGWGGFANNPLQAPDDKHRMFGGDATGEDSLASDDKQDLRLIDRLKTKAKTQGGGTGNAGSRLRPIRINGEDRFVYVMHEYAAHDLRTNTATGQWMDIQKAAAAAQGQRNPIFTGALGEYNNVILHAHEAVIRLNAGADGLQPIARNLFLGRQALVMAFGSPGQGLRFDWHEELEDRGNQVVITSSTIAGLKKSRFDNRDFGCYTASVYAADPG